MNTAQAKKTMGTKNIKKAVNGLLKDIYLVHFVPKEAEVSLFVGDLRNKWIVDEVNINIEGEGFTSLIPAIALTIQENREHLSQDFEFANVNIAFHESKRDDDAVVCSESEKPITSKGIYVNYKLTFEELEPCRYEVRECTREEVEAIGVDIYSNLKKERVTELFKEIGKTTKDAKAVVTI